MIRDFPATSPQHICEKFITFGAAAKMSGVPYQYIFGLSKRSIASKRFHRVSVRHDGQWKICEDCVKHMYGTDPTTANQLRVEPIRAYRSFTNVGDALTSWYDKGFIWYPRGAQAKCTQCNTVPGRRHSCGLYAVAEPTDEQLSGYGNIIGAVELWGHYVEGDRGWRAEWGKPVTLLCKEWQIADTVHRIAQTYGIAVVHNADALRNCWYDLEIAIGKEDDNGYRNGGEDGGSTSEGGASTGSSPGTATCREAARACSTIAELRFLVSEGIISTSNILELME